MEHNPAHMAHTAHHLVKDLKPLPSDKNPALAFVIGFFFGALGVGIYFRSWKDFFVCMALFFILTFTFPVLGSIAGWLFSPCYGLWRAISSNDERRGIGMHR